MVVVPPNDVVHADRHGAVVVPTEVIKELPAAASLPRAPREGDHRHPPDTLPGFSVARLRQAFADQEEIH